MHSSHLPECWAVTKKDVLTIDDTIEEFNVDSGDAVINGVY